MNRWVRPARFRKFVYFSEINDQGTEKFAISKHFSSSCSICIFYLIKESHKTCVIANGHKGRSIRFRFTVKWCTTSNTWGSKSCIYKTLSGTPQSGLSITAKQMDVHWVLDGRLYQREMLFFCALALFRLSSLAPHPWMH